MKLHKAKQQRPTKRQLELLAVVGFGEVYIEWIPSPRLLHMHIFERRGWGEFDRPIDVTTTIARMRAMKLVKITAAQDRNKPQSEWERIICLTARGRDVAGDACIDLP